VSFVPESREDLAAERRVGAERGLLHVSVVSDARERATDDVFEREQRPQLQLIEGGAAGG
jgi:hypothetical protein